MVIRSDSICRSITSMSNRRCNRIQVPVSSAIAMLSSPRMCDGGVMICMRSADDKSSALRQCCTATANEACVWRTALGIPVVPELKTNSASDSGAGASKDRSPGVIASSNDSIGIDSASTGWSPTAYPGLVSAERVLHLGALPRRAEQDRRGTQQPDGPQRDDEFGPIGRHDRDPVTRAAHHGPRGWWPCRWPGRRVRTACTHAPRKRARSPHSQPCPHSPRPPVTMRIENSVSFKENGIL